MQLSYFSLKNRHRSERGGYSSNLSVRVHRALSWLERAEQEKDEDSRFIFLWIAFNAAYATEIDTLQGLDQQTAFNAFIQKLHDLDTEKRLDQLVWTSYPSSIRVLLDNRYVFKGFWEYQQSSKTKEDWELEFSKAKKASNIALSNHNTPVVLAIVLSRIYVLRNQLVHGGATWNSSVNRSQVRDCVAIMDQLVPLLLEIMMDNPNTLWGDINFPPVQE